MSYDYVTVKKGQRVRSIEVKKFGSISAAPTAAFQEVWDGGEAFQGWDKTPYIPQIASVSATDVGIKVTVEGLDDEGYLQVEDILLNGQTPVALDNSYTMLFRAYIPIMPSPTGDIWAGSGAFTLGIPANKRLLIPYDNNQTLMLFWTVPKGFYIECKGFRFTLGQGKEITIRQRMRTPGGVWRTQDFLWMYQNTLDFPCKVLNRAEEGTDIAFEVLSGGIGVPLAGVAEFVMYEYEWLSSINPKNR